MNDLPLTGTEPITTSVTHRCSVAVLAVVGEIDMSTAPLFEEAIDDVLADDPPTLVIDLTEVTLLASVGLRLLATANERFVLATANKRFGESGGFAVVARGPETIRPIELTDLNEVFDLYLSLNDALAAVRSKPRSTDVDRLVRVSER
jgi:anti-sigma B factor antagonist